MALKKCKECGKEISSKAKTCPNCGAPIKKQISTGSGCLIIILFVIFIAWIFSSVFDTPSSIPSSTSAKQWFHGGNLHNATVAQWKGATYQNKLATASDWLAATEWKGHLNSREDFDRIKVKAQMLVRAVDKVVTGKEMEQLDFMKVNEIAASLVTMSNDLGP